MEVQGKIKVIGETQTFGTFQKRELVVVTQDGEYSQTLGLEFHQDKCSLLDEYKVGDNVKVSINLRGKEWINPDMAKNPNQEARYFNSIVGWKIEKVEDNIEAFKEVNSGDLKEAADDLPF
jgi:hypothetical protein